MGKNRKPSARKVLIYGSLYMDERESYEFAKTQIDECIRAAKLPHERLILAFDIIATPAQITSGLARQWGRHILDYCDKQYPKLSARVIGITDNDHRRVMRDTLITKRLTQNQIDGIHLIEME